jgi:hypothetical protein
LNYDDTKGNGTIRIDLTNDLQVNKTFIWGGYNYLVSSVTYGPPSVAFNLLNDIPGCKPDSTSPKIPIPHGSIDITATNSGNRATSDETQISSTITTHTIRISIPVYNKSDINNYTPVLSTPANISTFETNKVVPPQVSEVLKNTRLVYYRHPTEGTVFCPIKGLVYSSTSPPAFSPSRGSGTPPVIMRSILSGTNRSLILPNNQGTATVSSAVTKPIIQKTSESNVVPKPGQGIPVVVTDSNGKRVVVSKPKSEEDTAEYSNTIKMALRFILIFLVISMSLIAVFGFMPSGHSEYALLMLGISYVLSMIMVSQTAFVNKVVTEGDTPITSILIFVELILTLIVSGISGGYGFSTGIILGNPNETMVSYLIPTLITCISVMLLTLGISGSSMSKLSYNLKSQTDPLYYDRIILIFKNVIPLVLLFLFTGSIFGNHNPLLNMTFNPDNLTGSQTKATPFNGDDNQLSEGLFKIFSNTTLSPVDFAQYPIGEIQNALTNINIGSKSVLGALTKSKKTMVINKKSGKPYYMNPDNTLPNGINATNLLQKPAFMDNLYTNVWYGTISFVITIFLCVSLILPSLIGNIAFKSEERENEEKRTLGGTIIDGLYGIGLPLFIIACIFSLGLWTTGNQIQFVLLLLGPIVAVIVNMIALMSGINKINS